ncbi:hypothetical protein HDU97_006365 [Phlyctochytrium planicorne]|nr:hypothetical protein HDU97_006365 [Phlyctochytrium planicorne]
MSRSGSAASSLNQQPSSSGSTTLVVPAQPFVAAPSPSPSPPPPAAQSPSPPPTSATILEPDMDYTPRTSTAVDTVATTIDGIEKENTLQTLEAEDDDDQDLLEPRVSVKSRATFASDVTVNEDNVRGGPALEDVDEKDGEEDSGASNGAEGRAAELLEGAKQLIAPAAEMTVPPSVVDSSISMITPTTTTTDAEAAEDATAPAMTIDGVNDAITTQAASLFVPTPIQTESHSHSFNPLTIITFPPPPSTPPPPSATSAAPSSPATSIMSSSTELMTPASPSIPQTENPQIPPPSPSPPSPQRTFPVSVGTVTVTSATTTGAGVPSFVQGMKDEALAQPQPQQQQQQPALQLQPPTRTISLIPSPVSPNETLLAIAMEDPSIPPPVPPRRSSITPQSPQSPPSPIASAPILDQVCLMLGERRWEEEIGGCGTPPSSPVDSIGVMRENASGAFEGEDAAVKRIAESTAGLNVHEHLQMGSYADLASEYHLSDAHNSSAHYNPADPFYPSPTMDTTTSNMMHQMMMMMMMTSDSPSMEPNFNPELQLQQQLQQHQQQYQQPQYDQPQYHQHQQDSTYDDIPVPPNPISTLPEPLSPLHKARLQVTKNYPIRPSPLRTLAFKASMVSLVSEASASTLSSLELEWDGDWNGRTRGERVAGHEFGERREWEER